MTFTSAGPDSLEPIRSSVALTYAPAEAANQLEDALGAIGGPAIVPRPLLILDDQFPAQLFHTAIDRLASAAVAKPTLSNRAIGSPSTRLATGTDWRLAPSMETEGLAWPAFEN